MRLDRLCFFAIALLSLAPHREANAQPRTEPRPPSPVSLDVAIGGGLVRHDAFAIADGLQAEALLAGRLVSRSAGSLIAAVSGYTMVVGFGDNLECRVDPGTTRGCYGQARLSPTAALLGGAEFRRYGAALRVLAGPIRYREEGESARSGTHLRLDLAVPASSGIAFVVATRMSYLGRFRGEAIEIVGMSAGLRLQR